MMNEYCVIYYLLNTNLRVMHISAHNKDEAMDICQKQYPDEFDEYEINLIS
jgi:hypothetical protein